MPAAMLAPKLPSGFGPYTLVQRLAQGGMAEVFLARQRSSGGSERNLVIKRILPHLAEDQEFITMFQQEARLAMQLSHPNIVHTYDFGREAGTFYIALEYVDGPSLQTLLKHSRKPVPKAIAVRIACGIAAGLAYAHQATDEDGNLLGLVHRDVSPPNILVARDGSVKLVDFGIAKALHRTPGTHSTTLKGKFAYMAPEQFDGDVTQRVDIYALGVCLYEMLSGESLFRQKTVAELIRAVCASEIDPLRTRAPWVPEALEAIVMRALDRDPEQRYQSAETLLLVLERFLTQQGLVASPMLVGEWVRDTLSQPAAKRRTPSIDQPAVEAPGARESDPFDITSVRRQPAEPSRPAEPLEDAPRPSRAPRDTMPQEFIVLSSRPATDPEQDEGTPEVERTPVELTEPLAGHQLRPPAPIKPTAGPTKTPVPPERVRRRTPGPSPAVEFEKTTSPRPAEVVPEAAGPLEQAAARLAAPSPKKPSSARIPAPAPSVVTKPAVQGLVYDEDKTLADPEARAPGSRGAPPDDTERTLSLPPDRKPGAAAAAGDAVALLARKLATIPDPTEPQITAFPVRPGPPAPKAPAPTREPPRPVVKPAPLAVPARPRTLASDDAPTPAGIVPPAVAAAAETTGRQRETKPAPPPRTAPMEAVPALTTPMPRVSPPAAPPIFTAKPAAATAEPAPSPTAEAPAVEGGGNPTQQLQTADLIPVRRVEDAEDTNETLLRVPAPAAELMAKVSGPAGGPPPIAPAVRPTTEPIAPPPAATDAPPMPTPLPLASAMPVPPATVPASPAAFAAPSAKSRLEIPPELLEHTPSRSDSLTDVVTSAAFPLPRDLETEATRVKDAETEATKVKVGSELGLSAVGPTEALPAARISEPMTMGPTVVLPEPAARDPLFSAAPAEAVVITEQVLKPSLVVSPGGRSSAGIAIALIAVVLVAGGLGLYLATAHQATAVADPGTQVSQVAEAPPPVPVDNGIPVPPVPTPPPDTTPVAQVDPPVEPGPTPSPTTTTTTSTSTSTPTPPPQGDPTPPPTPPTPPTPRIEPAPTKNRNPVTLAADPPRPRQNDNSRPGPGRPRNNDVVRDPPAPRPSPPPAGGNGRLFVNTEPWSHVIVAGTDVGTTPVANISVPAGRVRLTLIDPDGHRFSRTVRVESGEQKRVFFQLQ